MSVRMLTQVWYNSRHKGNALLLLLAIADNADDEGFAFPGIKYLALKARMSERNVQYLLRVLEKSGELKVYPNSGPRKKNLYKIMPFSEGAKFAPRKSCTLQDSAKGGAKPSMKNSEISHHNTTYASEPSVRTVKDISPSVNHLAKGDKQIDQANLIRLGIKPGSTVWQMLCGDGDGHHSDEED